MERDSITKSLEEVGATVLANACGPCIGQWKRKDVEGENGKINDVLYVISIIYFLQPSSLPSTGTSSCFYRVTSVWWSTRNFRSRNDGNKNTMNFLASPTIVTAMAFSGKLSFNPMRDSITLPSGASFKFTAPLGDDLPLGGFAAGDPSLYPSPSPKPQPDTVIAIRPDSQRLEILEPFASHFETNNSRGLELPTLKVLMRVRGKCTTDHISAAVRLS